MKRLIVNADDFGLTAGVNRAIVELNRSGILSSATLMAVAPATAEAVSLAHATPALGIGCHVVLVDGVPALPPSQLPTLVDSRTGRFRPTLGAFVRDLTLGRIRPAEIEAEAYAQIDRLRSFSLTPTHIDTHKHTHMFQGVLKPLLRAAQGLQIPAIRNPFEPNWSLAATHRAPLLRRTQVHLLSRLRPTFLRLVAESGLHTTDGAIGVLATGTLDREAIASLLRTLPDGTSELVTHPGYNDSDLARAGTRLLASRTIEMEALNTTALPEDVELIDFRALVHVLARPPR